MLPYFHWGKRTDIRAQEHPYIQMALGILTSAPRVWYSWAKTEVGQEDQGFRL